MAEAFRRIDVTRVRDGERAAIVDRAATEEPLEIRLHGRPFAVIMRTPGADRELAAGFLLAERVIADAGDIRTIEYLTDGRDGAARGPENGAGNVVNVILAGASARALDRVLADRRQVTTNSSCGLCGRLTIDSLRADAPPLECTWTVDRQTLAGLPNRLRAAQAVFDETGGLHAAGLFSAEGRVEQVAEDVGRHNAVDKVIGRMLIDGRLPLGTSLLFVSGRTSYEIVQKAFLAGIPIVGAVSAPSTLAIDLAREAGVTLVGFVRGDSFNIYAHPDRIEP
jgi:FdhD protein